MENFEKTAIAKSIHSDDHINMNINCGMRGLFKFEATDSITGKKRIVADWFPNLITNAGLDGFGTVNLGSSYLQQFCKVGTGTTTPAVTDTSLQNQIASTSTTLSQSTSINSSSPYNTNNTIVKRFATGVAAGNLTEVGMGNSSTGGILWSRALILDNLGNPTTITILSTEILDVTYQLQLFPPLTDIPYTVSISAVSYTGVIRAGNVTFDWRLENVSSSLSNGICYTGTIGAITALPSGALANTGTSTSTNAYVSGSYNRSGTITFPTTAAIGTIASVVAYFNFCEFQVSLSPSIVKTNAQQLTLNFNITWSRYP